MSWTLNGHGERSAPWADSPRKATEYEHSLTRFFATVDVLFYAAAALFAVCVIALLIQ